MPSIELGALNELLTAAGLTLHAVIDVPSADAALARASEKLATWQLAGYAGAMGYMARPPELFSSVRRILPEARTVVVAVLPYRRRTSPGLRPPATGRVARYAWGLDYHDVLKRRLNAVVRAAEARAGEAFKSRVFSDAVPILERTLVAQSGLGFIGRNTLFIRPGDGSFSFLAEILWDAEVTGLPPVDPKILPETEPGSGCGTCRRCIVSCPTDAFVSPGTLDSRRCIAYLTIEKRGELTSAEQQMIGDWIFGCDICQEVCPFNHRGVRDEPLAELTERYGAGPYLALEDILRIRLNGEFTRRFGNTALERAGRGQLVRNAACVAANMGAFQALSALIETAAVDPSDIARDHATASLRRMLTAADGSDRRRIVTALSRSGESLESAGGPGGADIRRPAGGFGWYRSQVTIPRKESSCLTGDGRSRKGDVSQGATLLAAQDRLCKED